MSLKENAVSKEVQENLEKKISEQQTEYKKLEDKHSKSSIKY